MLNNEKRKVKCIELNKVFDSIEEANRFIGYIRCVENALNPYTANETAGNYHWMYVDEIVDEIIDEIVEPIKEPIKEEVVEEVVEPIVEEIVKPNIFICSECGKEYKTERGLRKHIESKH